MPLVGLRETPLPDPGDDLRAGPGHRDAMSGAVPAQPRRRADRDHDPEDEHHEEDPGHDRRRCRPGRARPRPPWPPAGPRIRATGGFSFDGPFGTFDQGQLQRGYKVYREVCSACHSMNLMHFRTLAEPGGPFYDSHQPKTRPPTAS